MKRKKELFLWNKNWPGRIRTYEMPGSKPGALPLGYWSPKKLYKRNFTFIMCDSNIIKCVFKKNNKKSEQSDAFFIVFSKYTRNFCILDAKLR